jgi:deoxyribonuclease V
MTVLRVDMDDDDFEFDEDQSATYKGELLTGVLVEHWPNGQLANETGYENGKPHGVSRFWYDDGAPESETTIEHNRAVGVSRGWYRNGQLKEERYFEDGALVDIREWDEDGQFIVRPMNTLGFEIPSTAEDAERFERTRIRRARPFGPVPDPLFHVAGVDIRSAAAADGGFSASAVLLDAGTLETVETSTASVPLAEPRLSETLGFQEVLTVIRALGGLSIAPGLIVCVGEGPNHPVELNFATHLGVAVGKPTFGVSGEAYLGTYEEPGPERGAWSELVDDGKVIGRALRTQAGQPAVFVTQGQRLGLDGAVELTLRLTENGTRLPASTIAAAAALDA